MSKKPLFCCATFPKGAWWLLALLGTPLLFMLMIMSKQGIVEHDLTTRTTQQLNDKNITWATINLDQHGRDAVLSGSAPDTAAHDQALDITRDIYGVRYVSNKMTIEEKALIPATLALTSNDEGIILTGKMPNQAAIDALVTTTEQAYAGQQVTNQLTVDNSVAEVDWLPAINTLIPTLAGLKQASLSISNDKKSISGIIASEAEKEAMLLSMTTAFGEKQSFDENITIEVPLETPQIETAITTTETSKSDPVVTETTTKPITAETTTTDPTVSETATNEPATEPKENSAGSNATETSIAKAKEPAINACQDQLNTVMQNRKILFANDRAEIRVASFPLLNNIASIINQCKDVISNKGISINGHTDSRGRDSYNQTLSKRRANAVKSYLTKKNVDDALMTAKGYGETQPIADNKTDKGRAQNRRITFKIKN